MKHEGILKRIVVFEKRYGKGTEALIVSPTRRHGMTMFVVGDVHPSLGYLPNECLLLRFAKEDVEAFHDILHMEILRPPEHEVEARVTAFLSEWLGANKP